MRISASLIVSPFIAVLVGFAGSVPVVIAAMQAVGASSAQIASSIAIICLSVAFTTLVLSLRYRLPLVTAWSFPGSAAVAASAGVNIESAAGAFLFAGALLMLTALSKTLETGVKRLPINIAAAMLAGILFGLVVQMFPFIAEKPVLVLGMLAAYFVMRLFSQVWAVIAAIIIGVSIGVITGDVGASPEFTLSTFVWVTPAFDVTAIIGLGVPLYLVTMVSQNLTGFAVLRASGYEDVPTRPIVLLTGAMSAGTAFFGSLSTNLAAITAAICTSADCHPDRDERWKSGIAYALGYAGLAACTGTFIALFENFPNALVASIAGIALLNPFMAALLQSVENKQMHLPAISTFLVTASGMSLLGVGSPFWGLLMGLAVMSLQKALVHFQKT